MFISRKLLAALVCFSFTTYGFKRLSKEGEITYNKQVQTIYRTKKKVISYYMKDAQGNKTPVTLTCIKKGLIGMPNVSMPSYRGMFTSKTGERCYVFEQTA